MKVVPTAWACCKLFFHQNGTLSVRLGVLDTQGALDIEGALSFTFQTLPQRLDWC
jgi:hypothetical protein